MVQPNGSAAVAKARQYHTCKIGQCLWYNQEWWGSPHRFPSAWEQWLNTVQHRDRAIPVGAPVFYSGGKYGHIAMYVGGGMVRSTDVLRSGSVGEVPIDWFYGAWGRTYVGWGSTLGGVALPLNVPVPPAQTPVYVSQLHFGQMNSTSVRIAQMRLNTVLRQAVPTTGNYLLQTDALVRSYQKSIGDPVDPVGRSSLGPKQTARLFAGTNYKII